MANPIKTGVLGGAVLAMGMAMAWTSVAVAQPGMAETQPVPPPTVTKPAAGHAGVANDVNANRGWLFPTALTQPQGTWTISNFEVLGFGLAYGISDAIEVSVNAIVIPDEEVTPTWFTGKAQILRTEQVHLAVHGAAMFGDRDRDESAALLGLAGTICLDTNCDSNVSGYAGRLFSSGYDDDERVSALGITYTQKLTKGVKAVVEIDQFKEQNRGYNDGISMVWYGVRFSNNRVGVDIGLLKPLGDSNDEFPVGLPWINFTFRTGN